MEQNYIIAGKKTRIYARKGWTTEIQAEQYLCDFDGEPDIIVGVNDDFIAEMMEKYPHLSADDCEYIWTGEQFYRKLLTFDGFMLHSSAVVYEDKGYLFSASSGTGKSTHTGLWREVFGEEAYIINDDKPVLCIENDKVMVYGTPWSGKTDQSKNVCVPLQGICFIERAADNWIEPISSADALCLVMSQTIRPQKTEEMEKLLSVLDRVLSKARIFKMGCNISHDAVKVAYEGMNASEHKTQRGVKEE